MATETITGWLFDNFAFRDRMILWVKERNGNLKRLEHPWAPSIYVASHFKSDLKSLLHNSQVMSFVKEHDFVKKHEHARDKEKREVLRLTLKDSFQTIKLAKKIENHCGEFGKYRLYNVDIPNEQSYLYEHDIFPIGIYNITKKECELEWTTNNDSIHCWIP